jgi:hypothetical protein
VIGRSSGVKKRFINMEYRFFIVKGALRIRDWGRPG